MLAAASLTLASAAQGQQFPIPGKPVRIVVPFTAGGPLDNQVRIIAQRMAETLTVPVIVENRPEASTMIGTREVQRAAPDGHTLLYTFSPIVQMPLLYRTPPWNVFTDFTPITAGTKGSLVLTAHITAPFNTVAELVAYAKANPGKLSYSSFGVGSVTHLYGEMFKRLAGIDIVHVPYKGSNDAMRDQMSGEVVLSFDGLTTAVPNARSGIVKIIATAAEERSPALPDMPTMREQGYDVGLSGHNWFLGPAGMPPAVVDTVYGHLAKAITRPDVRELFAKVGIEASGMPPSEIAQALRRSHEYWEPIIRELGVRLD